MSKKNIKIKTRPALNFDTDDDSSVVESSDSEPEESPVVEQKSGELEIKRMTLHKQILHRPDTYLGSVRRLKTSDRVWVMGKDGKFVCKEAVYAEGLIRMLMEVCCNIIDNIWRSKQYNVPAKLIKINIDKKGQFSAWNDGFPIPLDKFVEDGVETEFYKPEVIFGQLLTSTNYDDTEKRKTSGRNGYGVKLASIFSKQFEIEAFNPKYGVYKQQWNNNMFDRGEPSLSSKKSAYPKGHGKQGYTQVTWTPDYERFGMKGIDSEFMEVAEKCIHDYALIAKMHGVSTIYNGEEIPISDLKSYANMFFSSKPEEMMQFKSNDCTVVVAPRADVSSKSKLMQFSFMNGISTADGGVHVDAWEEAIFRPIVNKINKVKPDTTEKKKDTKKTKGKAKAKTFQVNIDHVRQHFSIFIVAEADNPDFKGQNKTYFNGPAITVNVKRADITKLCKWSFMDRIQDTIKLSELSALKDVGKKKRNYVRIENLNDANNAGDKKLGGDCALMLTEGDSAATYVINGMKYGIDGRKGHDWIGVLPLRGKFINVRNASNSSIMKNKEVIAIIKSLGLEYGLDYSIKENRDKLRYGKLYIVADGDFDGLHIIGLLYNFFDTLFPSLIESSEFFHFLRIPIVKVSHRQEKLSFLFYHQAKQWMDANKPSQKSLRYFKGLGTSNKQDIKEDFGRYPVAIVRTEEGVSRMNQVFQKDETDFRKDWLLNYVPTVRERKTPDYKIEHVNAQDFLDHEMITFSIDDCARSIPNVIDSLKEGQRKCLFAAFKRRLNYNKKSMKVAQFAGYTAEHTGYHHGEQNLFDTITRMGQRFVGSNNVPIFYADGQFGSRSGGGNKKAPGKDAAKARYLFTKLDALTRYIYREEDDLFLNYREDEGQFVEPHSYYPIVPMILVNGGSGIGTGSSCNVPMYNVMDLIEWIKVWIARDGEIYDEDEEDYATPELIPHWRNFKGTVEVGEEKVTTYGVLTEINESTWKITELPVGRLNMSIQKYKEILEDMRENKEIKRLRDESTDDEPVFTITVDGDGLYPNLKNMKLVDTISTTNMVLFDDEGNLKKFDSVNDIMIYYCEKRMEMYNKRKAGQLKFLKEDLKWVRNKINFIDAIDGDSLVIKDRNEDELYTEMDSSGFDRRQKVRVRKNVEESDDDDEGEGKESGDDQPAAGTFDYLLDMKVRTLNVKSSLYKKLINDRESLVTKIDELTKISCSEIWIRELDELVKEYPKWERSADSCDHEGAKKKKRLIKK